jgi:hypothetical protein
MALKLTQNYALRYSEFRESTNDPVLRKASRQLREALRRSKAQTNAQLAQQQMTLAELKPTTQLDYVKQYTDFCAANPTAAAQSKKRTHLCGEIGTALSRIKDKDDPRRLSLQDQRAMLQAAGQQVKRTHSKTNSTWKRLEPGYLSMSEAKDAAAFSTHEPEPKQRYDFLVVRTDRFACAWCGHVKRKICEVSGRFYVFEQNEHQEHKSRSQSARFRFTQAQRAILLQQPNAKTIAGATADQANLSIQPKS